MFVPFNQTLPNCSGMSLVSAKRSNISSPGEQGELCRRISQTSTRCISVCVEVQHRLKAPISYTPGELRSAGSGHVPDLLSVSREIDRGRRRDQSEGQQCCRPKAESHMCVTCDGHMTVTYAFLPLGGSVDLRSILREIL